MSRSAWTTTASSTEPGGSPQNAVDGSLASRWSSGKPMTGGEWFQIDLGSVQTFDRIVLDSGSSVNDFARGYQILISNNGTDWATQLPVAVGTGNNPLTDVSLAGPVSSVCPHSPDRDNQLLVEHRGGEPICMTGDRLSPAAGRVPRAGTAPLHSGSALAPCRPGQYRSTPPRVAMYTDTPIARPATLRQLAMSWGGAEAGLDTGAGELFAGQVRALSGMEPDFRRGISRTRSDLGHSVQSPPWPSTSGKGFPPEVTLLPSCFRKYGTPASRHCLSSSVRPLQLEFLRPLAEVLRRGMPRFTPLDDPIQFRQPLGQVDRFPLRLDGQEPNGVVVAYSHQFFDSPSCGGLRRDARSRPQVGRPTLPQALQPSREFGHPPGLLGKP